MCVVEAIHILSIACFLLSLLEVRSGNSGPFAGGVGGYCTNPNPRVGEGPTSRQPLAEVGKLCNFVVRPNESVSCN